MTHSNEADDAVLDLAVRRGLVSRDTVESARKLAGSKPISDNLVTTGHLAEAQVDDLRREYAQMKSPTVRLSPGAALAHPPEVAEAMRNSANHIGSQTAAGEPKFVLLRRLGAGGFGTVRLAWQTDLRRYVAIKELREDDPALVERLLREARAAANLRHPNIAAIHDIGQHEGRNFIVMEYVSGSTLENAGLPATGLVRAIASVARALHTAHQRQIIHRDIKPSNIMIDADGRAVLLDFGLARGPAISGPHTATGSVLGTPHYMAPEQAEGRIDRIGPWTDVYSLGATLYHMASGRKPYDADNPVRILHQVVAGPPPPIRSVNPNVPADLGEIVERAMARDPVQRFGTAEALATALESCSLFSTPSERATTIAQPPTPPVTTPSKKFPWIPIAVAAGVVLAGVGVWLAVSGGSSRTPSLRAGQLEALALRVPLPQADGEEHLEFAREAAATLRSARDEGGLEDEGVRRAAAGLLQRVVSLWPESPSSCEAWFAPPSGSGEPLAFLVEAAQWSDETVWDDLGQAASWAAPTEWNWGRVEGALGRVWGRLNTGADPVARAAAAWIGYGVARDHIRGRMTGWAEIASACRVGLTDIRESLDAVREALGESLTGGRDAMLDAAIDEVDFVRRTAGSVDLDVLEQAAAEETVSRIDAEAARLEESVRRQGSHAMAAAVLAGAQQARQRVAGFRRGGTGSELDVIDQNLAEAQAAIERGDAAAAREALSRAGARMTPDLGYRLDPDQQARLQELERTYERLGERLAGMSDDFGDAMADSFVVGVPVAIDGNLETPGDQDWFHVRVDAPMPLTISVALGTCTDTVIEVYDAYGTKLIDNDDGEGMGLGSLIRDWTPPAPGSYFICVRGYSTETSGTYLFRVDQQMMGWVNLYRQGGALETTDLLGPRPDHQECTGEYYDTWTMDVQAGDRVRFSLTSGEFDAFLWVADAADEIFTDDDSGEASNSELELTFGQAGTITIGCTSYGEGAMGAYELAIDRWQGQ